MQIIVWDVNESVRGGRRKCGQGRIGRPRFRSLVSFYFLLKKFSSRGAGAEAVGDLASRG